MKAQTLARITNTMLANIRRSTPYKTGNLAMFATRSEPLAHGSYRIYVNTKGDHKPESRDGIAPYFVYVNYQKTLRGRGGASHANPNYQYWDKAVKKEVARMAKEIGGVVTVV